MTSITIPSFVSYIGYSAFEGCSSLTGSLTIPSSVTSIGFSAFQGCVGLNGSLVIPSSVTSLGDHAFSGCTGIKSLSLSANITAIKEYTFENCSSLKGDLSIPSTVTSIGDAAFWNCSGLTSVTIPLSVATIGGGSFYGCSGLTSATLPASITSIGNNAFQSCSGLTGSLVIPSTVTSIGSYSYQGCNKLTLLSIPSSITSIGNSAFSGCTALTSVYAYKTTPINLSTSTLVFNNVNKTTCTLYVPGGSKSAYQAANQWKDFVNIVEMAPPIVYKNFSIHVGLNGYIRENGINYVKDTILSVVSGTTKSFTIIPNAGYEIASLTYNGVNVKSQIVNSQYTTATINADATLSVTFQKIKYNLSIKSAESGSAYLICGYGDTPSFGFAPANGWKIHNITYNGTNYTNSLVNGIFTTPAITENALLNVSFELIDAVQAVSDSPVSVYTTQSDIIIDGTVMGEFITLYNINGVQLQRIQSKGTQVTIPFLQSGVYLVKTSNKTVKVLL